MKRPEIVMATKENLAEVGEATSRGGRAIAAVLDGRTIGVAGYYLDNGRVVVYSTITSELRLHKRTIIRGAMILMGMIDHMGLHAQALADDVDRAERLLEHIGFDRLEGRVYGRAPWRRQVH